MTLGAGGRIDEAAWAKLLWAAGLLLALLLVGSAGVWYYRRRLTAGESGSSAPWTLHDLRQLRAAGQLTEQEYERLRSEIIAQFTGRRADSGAESPPRADGDEPDG